MTVDLKQLRELAEKALGSGRAVPGSKLNLARSAYIAAVSPNVMIELLDDIEQLRQACATWQSIFTGMMDRRCDDDRHSNRLAEFLRKVGAK